MSADLRYPIGRFHPPSEYTAASRAAAIRLIAETPRKFRAAVTGLSDAQLDTPYRDGGWTVRQLAHHVPDSHLNAYVRTKLALTEDNPTIKPYDEKKWADLVDSRMPVEPSLAMLDAIHERWVAVLNALTPEQFSLPFTHPEHGPRTIDWLVALYAWHGPHHTAHVTELRRRNNWSS
jgi:hypothetical protein